MISLLSDILNFLFPRTCVMCGKRLSTNEHSICSTCIMHLPRTDFNSGQEGSELEKMFWAQFPVERAASFFHYRGDSVRHIVHTLKYSDQPLVGYDLARIAAEEMLGSGFFEDIDCIVPVPIHWRRMLRRHYNQSGYIARGLSSMTGIPIYNNVVKRTVNNASQTHLTHDARKENVTGIFRLINRERIAGKHILLVDDVITTGSTIGSCAKTLAQAEDVRISIFSLARASSKDTPTIEPHPAVILSHGLPLLD